MLSVLGSSLQKTEGFSCTLTVAADGFEREFLEFLMVKLLRAYGECLGARSR